MPVFNHDFRLNAETPESASRPVAGADRFGFQIVGNASTATATVVLQGSLNGSDWVDLAEATLRSPLVGAGGTAKSPVVRYVRAVAKVLTGDGAVVSAYVTAK